MVEERVKRRLAAILAADMVGYSRLMAADEAGTLARLKSLRVDLVDPKITQNHGRIVKLMGDGLLVEFGSVTYAALCAVEIQRSLSTKNADESEEQRIALRIAIHIGDIIVEGDDIYGDAVNIAARLEGLAGPGGIVLSGDAYRQIKGKIDFEFEDIGDHRVKNIAEPIHVYRVRLGQNDPATVSRSEEASHHSSRSALAVLPFANLSGDAEQEYFSEGLTEDIITALSAWRTFPVIARNSVFVYKGMAVKVQQVAEDLGARYVLEGSVRKGGNRVRITIQLIDAKTGHHLWAKKFDRELEDIFDVQDEITQQVVATVAPELEMAEHRRGTWKPTTNPDAWDYYQRGMSAFHRLAKDANAEAREMFEQAIELDEADASIRVTFGNALLHAGQFERAIAEQERALEFNPNNAFAYAQLGLALNAAGRPEEAISQLEKALRICPARDTRADHMLTWLAQAHLNNRDYEQAAEWARKTIRRRAYSLPYIVLASSLGHLGRLAEAEMALDECERIDPGRVQKEFEVDSRPYQNRADYEHVLDGLRKAGRKG